MVQRTRIEGAAELEKVLKMLPKQITEKVLVSSVRAGANIVKKEMEARAPIGTEIKKRKGRTLPPGTLKKGIKTRRDKKSGASVTIKVGVFKKGFYGQFLEFGTKEISAKPFLRPAWEQTKMEALEKIGQALGKNIQKAAKKLAGSYAKSGLKVKRKRR